MSEIWIQGEALPGGQCFGCGPDNQQGLRLRSESSGSGVIAKWTPGDHHSGGGGFRCGGIIGSKWPGSQAVDDPHGGQVYLAAG